MYTEQEPAAIPAAILQMAHTAPNTVAWAWTPEEGSQGPQPAVNRPARGEPLPISTYSSIAMALDFSVPWPQAAAPDQGPSQHVDTPLHNTASDQEYSSVDGLVAESANQTQELGHETSAVVPGTTEEILMNLNPGRSTGNPLITTASSTASRHSFTRLPAGEQPSRHMPNNTTRGDAASFLRLSPPVRTSPFGFTTPAMRDVPEIASQPAGTGMNGERERAAKAVQMEWELIAKELGEGRDVSFHERKFIKSWDCYERVSARLLRCQETNCPSRKRFSLCSSFRKHVKRHYMVKPQIGETTASFEVRKAVAKAEGEAKVKEDKYVAAIEKFRSLAELVVYEPT